MVTVMKPISLEFKFHEIQSHSLEFMQLEQPIIKELKWNKYKLINTY